MHYNKTVQSDGFLFKIMKYFTYPFSNEVLALTTTKQCGNMAFQVTNNKNEVLDNRSNILKDLNIRNERLVLVHQTHSDVIKEVTKKDLGSGADSFESGIEADALYTKEKGIALGIFHADCEPVFFYDDTIPLVGIIHAGHKGTLKHIVLKSLSKVIVKEKLNPLNLKIWVGPLRRKDTYEVDEKEKTNIIYAACSIDGNHFDVALSNKLDMICLGIPEENIKDINIDTAKSNECFSAYKGDANARMLSMIMLK